MTPKIETDDAVVIASDPKATLNALQIQIVRTQEVPVWTGSLQSIDKEIASAEAERIELEDNHAANVAALEQKLADFVAFKAHMEAQIDTQKPVFMSDPVADPVLDTSASSTPPII